jgi:hypothetical protein
MDVLRSHHLVISPSSSTDCRGHLLHLHILFHVHRRRVQAYGSDRPGVQHDDANVVCGRVPPVRGTDVSRALGTIGATLLLAGAMAPLPYVYHLRPLPPPYPFLSTNCTTIATTHRHRHHLRPVRNQISGTLIYCNFFCLVLCCILWDLGPAKGRPVTMDLGLLETSPDLGGKRGGVGHRGTGARMCLSPGHGAIAIDGHQVSWTTLEAQSLNE